MAKRTHSTIDKLPADLRETITRMVTDGLWPDGFDNEAERHGTPTYGDIVVYCQRKGFDVSHSAVGRWGKKLQVFELLRSRAEIVRSVMIEGDNTADFSDTQRAAADLISARILETACSSELTTKQTKELAAAAKDCADIRIKTDQYRSQIEARIKTATTKLKTEITDTVILKKVQDAFDDIMLGIRK